MPLKVYELRLPVALPWTWPPTHWPRHSLCGLLLEGRHSLGVVQIGLGSLDFLAPWRRLGLSAARFDPKSSPGPLRQQLQTAGYHADEVTDIFLSHVHPLHTGGLSDFPRARVHGRPGALEGDVGRIRRLLPELSQWTTPSTAPTTLRGLCCHQVAFEDHFLQMLELDGPFPYHAGWLVPFGSRELLHLGALIEAPDQLRQPGLPLPNLWHDAHPFAHLVSMQTVKRFIERSEPRPVVLANAISPDTRDVSIPLLA